MTVRGAMAFVQVGGAIAHSFSRTSRTISRTSFLHTAQPRRAAASSKLSATTPRMQSLSIFTEAMKEFKDEFAPFANRGWGATVKAERWNGRHAMFGILFLVITAYCKGHGLLPEGNVDLSQWGNLAYLGDFQAISRSRAVILIAHVHFLFVSIAAAIAPFSFQDDLLLKDDEKDDEPVGLIPPLKFGLTKEAEIFNGRLAMLGVCVIVGTALASGTPILDVINEGVGGILYK